MPRDVLPLDKMVDFLAEEDEYWCRLRNDPRSWTEKQKGTAAAKERHLKKRRRLSHYLDPNTTVRRPSVSLTLSELEDEDEDEDDDVGDYTPQEPPTPPGLFDVADTRQGDSLTNADNDSNEPIVYGRKRLCPTCNRSKIINKDCSLMVCKECCSESTQCCRVTHHKRSKPGAVKPYLQTSLATQAAPDGHVLEVVKSAIDNKREVYISYNGGTRGDHPRKITPRAFTSAKEGQLVESWCHNNKETRHFYLHKITRVEYHDWSSDSVPPAPGIA